MLKHNPRISDVTFPYIQQHDDIGTVFFWEDRVYRGINAGKVDHVLGLFSSGFIDALISRQLLPSTKITDLHFGNFELVLEHEKIAPQINQFEWTFSMLKSAALLVLEVRSLAEKFGYGMKDCHTQNVMFKGSAPIYVDLGSFVSDPLPMQSYNVYLECLSEYYWPLISWANGNSIMAKLFLSPQLASESFINKARCFFLNKSYLFRLLPTAVEKYYIKINLKYIYLLIRQENIKFFNIKICLKNWLFKSLQKNIKRMTLKTQHSPWIDYQNNSDFSHIRYQLIIDTISQHCSNSESVVDVAGNQGKFILKLIQSTQLKKGINLDLDENAIDIGFLLLNQDAIKYNISFVHADFMSPYGWSNEPDIYGRFKSDIAICMALTHHLLLTQRYSLKQIMANLHAITNKFLFVEFMPKGLWDLDSGVSYDLPDDYSIDSFKEAVEQYFSVEFVRETAENRVLFFCRKNNIFI
jgi:hypothetical protein